MILTVLTNLLNIQNILLLFLGVGTGIIFGALPGLSATIGITLLLPITYNIEVISGMLLLLGVYCGGVYGGSITAILIKTPGTAAAAATMLDGHALAKKGKAGKALDIALRASVFGGIVSATVLLLIAPTLSRFALKFGAPEKFALALVGLTIIPSVVGDSPLKGFMAAALGLFLSTIGFDQLTGIDRMTFGIPRFMAGIQLVPSMIGLFAVSQIMQKIFESDKKPDKPVKFSRERFSWRELIKYKVTLIRSSIIGIIVGAIPGTGPALSAFISYNEAKKSAKEPDSFGKGNPEGIIAAETANNGVTGATLIPLLTLGIPGDTATSVMMGALILNGITPGPTLFSEDPTLVYSIMLGIVIVNLVMLLQGTFLIKFFAKIAEVPLNLLLPVLSVFCIIGAYAINNSTFDIGTMIVFGLIGYILNKCDIPKTPVVIARILGQMAEINLRRALILSTNGFLIFFTSPISLACIFISVMSVLYPIYKAKKRKSGITA